jgi:hypothetical protein
MWGSNRTVSLTPLTAIGFNCGERKTERLAVFVPNERNLEFEFIPLHHPVLQFSDLSEN